MAGFGNPWSSPSWWSGWLQPPNTTGSSILENNTPAAYQGFLNAGGVGGDNTPMARWFNNQYQRQYNTYLSSAAQPGGPTRFQDFLKDQGPNLWQEYAALPASLQGQNPAQYSGRLRWVL
jgi:hypothetical protein